MPVDIYSSSSVFYKKFDHLRLLLASHLIDHDDTFGTAELVGHTGEGVLRMLVDNQEVQQQAIALEGYQEVQADLSAMELGTHSLRGVLEISGLTSHRETAVTVVLVNEPPVVGAIAAPVDPIAIGTTVEAGASFTDPNQSDTHTAVWNWRHGSSSDGTVTEGGGSSSVSGGHAYSAAGICD